MSGPRSLSTGWRLAFLPESLMLQAFLLLAWVGLWALLQALLRVGGLGEGGQTVALLVGLGVSFGFAWSREVFRRTLVSARFLVLQMGLLSLALALGTLIPQQIPSEVSQERYGAFLRGCLALGSLEDLFHSLWFSALLALLALAAARVAWERRPYPLARVGFLLVHVAPVFLLAGALLGRIGGVRAVQALKVGRVESSFLRLQGGQAGSEPYTLPGFRVQLQSFRVQAGSPRLRLWALEALDGQGRFQGEPTAFSPREGLKAELGAGAFHIEVLRVLPRAVASGGFQEQPEGPLNPAVRIVLGLGLPEPLVGHLFARDPEGSRQDEPGGRFSVIYREAWDNQLSARLKPRSPAGEKLVMLYQGQKAEHDLEAGRPWDVQGLILRLVKRFPDFDIRKGANGNPEAYSRSSQSREPWVQVQLELPGQSPRKLLLSAKNPLLTDRLNAPNLPEGLVVRYVRAGEETQNRFVVLSRSDQRIRLVEAGRVVRVAPLEVGRPFVVMSGCSVTPVALFDHASYVSDFAPEPDASQPARQALHIRVTDRSGHMETRWLEASGVESQPVPALFCNGKLGLVFRREPGDPLNYWSDLRLLDEEGRELIRGAVGVNMPLSFRGHRFYQGSYNPEDPSVSGVMVVREPGMVGVYLGLACLMIGVLWMVLLQPWLTGKGKA